MHRTYCRETRWPNPKTLRLSLSSSDDESSGTSSSSLCPGYDYKVYYKTVRLPHGLALGCSMLVWVTIGVRPIIREESCRGLRRFFLAKYSPNVRTTCECLRRLGFRS